MFKRRSHMRTDYRQRLALLKSGRPRLVVRKSLDNFHIQVVRYERDGDFVVAEAMTKELRKHGWKGHGGNLPSAYLTGMLAGIKARKQGISEVVADLGLQVSIRGNALYAAVAGARDAGLKIPAGKEALPDQKNIRGEHVARYAALLKKDQAKYKRQFSAYIRDGMDPEKIPEHFDEIKKKLMAEAGSGAGTAKKEVVAATSSGSVTNDSSGADSDDAGDGEEWEETN